MTNFKLQSGTTYNWKPNIIHLRINLFKAISAHQASMGNSLLILCSSLNGIPTDVMKPPAQCKGRCMRSRKQWRFYFHWFTYNNESYHFECIACTWIGTHCTDSIFNPQNCTRYILHIILWGFLLLLLFQTLDFFPKPQSWKEIWFQSPFSPSYTIPPPVCVWAGIRLKCLCSLQFCVLWPKEVLQGKVQEGMTILSDIHLKG